LEVGVGIKPKDGMPTKSQLSALGEAMMDARSVLTNTRTLLEMLDEEIAPPLQGAIRGAAADIARVLRHWDREE
jgi:hypothetical protein